jgi:hypothetical protein
MAMTRQSRIRSFDPQSAEGSDPLAARSNGKIDGVHDGLAAKT